MNRALTWLAAGLLMAVGIGAILMSTVDLGGTQAASTSYLTQAAVRGDVSLSAAATGTLEAAESYSLDFGLQPRLADATSTAASSQTWTVDEVLVSAGDRVTAGQVLATADTTDLDDQIAELGVSLGSARLTLREAQADLDDARQQAQRDLVDAQSAVTSARLSLRSAKAQRKDAASGTPTIQARMALISARDQLRTARQQREEVAARLTGDFPDETIARDTAQASVLDLQSQLADLTDELDHAQLVAPVDGVVTAVNITPGLVAPASDAVLVDSATLQVVADVVESDIASIAVGQPATVTIDALETDVAGTVTAVAPTTTGDSSSVVTFPVTVTLDDPDAAVRSGMSSDVEITIAAAPDVVTVPAVALMGTDGSYVVRVAGTDGSEAMRAVTVGLVSETLAEIQSGLAEGETVIVGTNTARTGTSEDASDTGPGGFGAMGGLDGLAGGGGPPPGAFQREDQ
jgi:RND family efflux transporter MFP subunit